MSMFRVRQFQMSKEVASQTSEGYLMPQITKKEHMYVQTAISFGLLTFHFDRDGRCGSV